MKFEQDPWPQRLVLHRVASHGLIVNLHFLFTPLLLRPHNHESVDSSKHITVTSKTKVDVALKIGSTETIVVQEEAHPILDTTDSTLGVTLSTNEIANIPLNGRNFSSLTLYQPGAVATDPTGLTGNNAIERNTFNSGVVTINGNRQQANNYMVEGADNNEPQNNLIGYNPAPDAIGEAEGVVVALPHASYGLTLVQHCGRRACPRAPMGLRSSLRRHALPLQHSLHVETHTQLKRPIHQSHRQHCE